jgi:hypothetical protein
MRLYVLHDREGRILAAANLMAEDREAAVPRPIAAGPEQVVVELEVPNEHRKGDLREICERLRVDLHRNQLVPRQTGE